MNWSNVSRAPFATVRAGCPRCPACGWRAEPGPNGGVAMALRIHCYCEHGLRLRLGGGRGRVPETPGGVDLGAEVAAHMWVARSALRNAHCPADPDIEADALVGLMEAILTWDHGAAGGFAAWASRIIRRIASDRRDHVTHRLRRPWGGAVVRQPARQGVRLAVVAGPGRTRPATPPSRPPRPARPPPAVLDGERRVMEARFPARGDGPRHAEVAAARGVSEERVRQIERSALAKLRWAMGGGSGKPPRPARPPEPPEPGYFVVLAGPDGLPTALDAGSVLRPSRGEVAVFTDGRAARAMANRLRNNTRCRGRVAESPPAEEGGATPWGTARLVHAAPAARARADTVRDTADAVRAAIAEAGRPLTLGEIARILSEPRRAAGLREVGYETARMAVRCHPGMFSEVATKRGRHPALFGLAAAQN